MSTNPTVNPPRIPRGRRVDRAVRSVPVSALVLADWRRLQRTWMVPLTLLGPAGVTLMGVVLFLLRGKWILADFDQTTQSGLTVVAGQLAYVHIFALCLGATLLASMVVDVEHRSDTWKSMFALPVRRWQAYLSKLGWTATLLAASSVLMGLGYAAIVTWQGIGPVEWSQVVRLTAIPWIGTLPLLAFQLLLSTAFRNQAVPLAVGIVTPMFGMGMQAVPYWFPWRLPYVALDAAGVMRQTIQTTAPTSAHAVTLAAVCVVALLLMAGAAMLERKEIA